MSSCSGTYLQCVEQWEVIDTKCLLTEVCALFPHISSQGSYTLRSKWGRQHTSSHSPGTRTVKQGPRNRDKLQPDHFNGPGLTRSIVHHVFCAGSVLILSLTL